ncbi:MAG TPA: hypothetical protein VF796_30010 [Humisphaera sp.]
MPPPDPAAPNIWSDAEAGEPLILLADLRDEPFMPRPRGKKLDKSVPFRWASRGKDGVHLEHVATPTGKATTRSAVLRFYARLSGAAPSVAHGPTRRARAASVRAAERELAAAGI